MVSIALRNLFHDKLKFLISISGVAFSVFLILIMLGLFRGWTDKIVKYIESTNADLWVLQKGSDDFFNSVSVLPVEYEDIIRKNDNVKEAHPLIGRQTTFELRDTTLRMYIIGYEPENGVGGPVKVIDGDDAPGEGEIIINNVFANTHGVRVGDKLHILDKDFNVAGIAQGGDLVFLQFAFMERSEAEKLLKMPGFVNFYVVTVKDNTKIVSTAGDIENQLENVSVATQSEYMKSNQREINEIFIPILTVLVFIGFLVGLTVVGLMTYTSTVEKTREYGILKAIGASNTFLYKIIFQQSFLTGIVGFLVGITLVFFSQILLEDLVPQFIIKMISKDVALTLILILVMNVASAYIPMRRIARIEPATVFK